MLKCYERIFQLAGVRIKSDTLFKLSDIYTFKKDEEKNTNPLTIEYIKKQVSNEFNLMIESLKDSLINKMAYKLIGMDKTPSNIYSINRRIDNMKRYFDNEFEQISISDIKIISYEEVSENNKRCNVEIMFKQDNVNYIKKTIIDFEYSNIENKIVNINNKNGYWKTDFAILLGNLTCDVKKL